MDTYTDNELQVMLDAVYQEEDKRIIAKDEQIRELKLKNKELTQRLETFWRLYFSAEESCGKWREAYYNLLDGRNE